MPNENESVHKHLPPKIWVPVLVVVVGVVGYLIYAISTPTLSPPYQGGDGEGVRELAGWQTYRNEEFGFEVKYPNDLEALPDSAFIYTTSDKSLPGPKFDLNVCFAPVIRTEFSCEFEVYVTKDTSELQPNKPIWISKDGICPQIALQAAPVLDGVGGSRVDICSDGNVVLKNVYVIRNNQAYLFATQEVDQSKLARFDQILSTFKFIK